MTSLDKQFENDSMAFGKILVVDAKLKLTTSVIKKLIGAKTIKKLKVAGNDVEQKNALLAYDVTKGLRLTREFNYPKLEFFEVTGDVASTFLMLKSSSLVYAVLDIDSGDFKKFHNAILRCEHIQRMKGLFDIVLERFHDIGPTIPKIYKQDFVGFKPQITKLKKNFGKKLYKNSFNEVSNFLSVKW